MRVVVLGGGFGGLTVATELAAVVRTSYELPGHDPGLVVRRGGPSGPPAFDITLIDRERDYEMGLSKLWIATGTRKAGEGRRDRATLERLGVAFVNEEIRKIDLEKKAVETPVRRVPYDRLVVALGVDLVPDAVPGLADHALNLYDFAGAGKVWDALNQFRGGTILIVICRPPFKCPPAPYEFAMMLGHLLRERGLDDKTVLEIVTPEPRPLPVLEPSVGARLADLLRARKIRYTPGMTVQSIERDRAIFAGAGGLSRGGPHEPVAKSFDLCICVPPHRTPAIVRESGLADESGFIPVENRTLKTRHPDVYAIGDCAKATTVTNMPIPRAGILAENQAKVVAANLSVVGAASSPPAVFDGKGYCFLEVGGGQAMVVDGDFFAEPMPCATLPPAPTTEAFEAKRRFESDRLRLWFGS